MRSALPVALLLAAGYVNLGQTPTAVVILGAADSALTIDWLDISPEGRVSVVETRTLPPAERVSVPIAVSPRRLVRFSRPGVSPVTVPSAELSAESWRLPPPAPGGELIVQRSSAAIVPQSYRLFANGTESTHQHGRGEFMMLRSMPAGAYQLTPVYSGDVAARVQKLRVEDGQTTFVFVPKEEVGGASVRLHPAVCAESSRIQIRHLSIETTDLPGGGKSTRTLTTNTAAIQPIAECELTIGGLKPGDHEFVLQKQSGEPVRRRFQVQTGALTEIVVDPAGTKLSGKVTLNGRPLADATVEFMTPEPPTQTVARGNTDARGNYAADFEKPGQYRAALRVRGVPLPGESRPIDVPAGETTFDLALTGGTLTVKVENVTAATARIVTLLITQIAPRVVDGRPGLDHSVRPDDPELMQGKLTFRGLGFGSYSIKARQQPARQGDRTQASPEVSFSLTEQSPDAAVTLVLADNFGQIVLKDSAGSPVTGARVYTTGAIARETEPGSYSMDGISPGVPLQIRATGYTPLCRLAPETSVTVAVDAGRTVEVQFPGLDGKEPSPWGWLQWEGSNCRIALDGFPFAKLPTGADGVPRFAISNFPRAENVSHSLLSEPARSYQVLYGVLVIPVKK